MRIIRWIDYPRSPCSDNREFAVQYCYIVTMVAPKRGRWSARTHLHQHLQHCNKTLNRTSRGGWRVNVLIHHNQTRILRQKKNTCTHNKHSSIQISNSQQMSASHALRTWARHRFKQQTTQRNQSTDVGDRRFLGQHKMSDYTVSGRRTLCVSCPNIRPLNMFIEWNCFSFRQKGKLAKASFLPLWNYSFATFSITPQTRNEWLL